jgi:DNA-binding transcriptional regulator YdaS (Cro superfamily)
MPEMSSAIRLREHLSRHGDARRVLMTEALYCQQVRYTCDLLDVVDEMADQATAERITDAICARMTGAAVAEAIERATQARRDYEDLARNVDWRSVIG